MKINLFNSIKQPYSKDRFIMTSGGAKGYSCATRTKPFELDTESRKGTYKDTTYHASMLAFNLRDNNVLILNEDGKFSK